MTTNEFERDLNAQAGLKRAGRVDFRVLQNTADAGDGHPGVQRCFRNYLHEGGMEKDLDLVGHGIKGASVLINNAELQQLSNIGSSIITNSIWSQLDNIEATTISAAQWVFVGEADQAVKIADSPTFDGLTINGAITITGNVDGVDVSIHDHSGAGQGGTVDHVNLDSKGTNTHTQIDAHIVSTATPHTSAAEKTSWGTAVTHIGESGASHTYIDQSVIGGANPTFGNPTVTEILSSGETIKINPRSSLYKKEIGNWGAHVVEFNTGASTSQERGKIGSNEGGTTVPYIAIYTKELFTDDGNVGSYSIVDDLQLLRDLKEWEEREKPLSPEFPEFTQKVWDKETLPWIVAHSNVNAMDTIDNNKRYSLPYGAKIGYLLSTIKKLLERQDKLIEELNNRGINVTF